MKDNLEIFLEDYCNKLKVNDKSNEKFIECILNCILGLNCEEYWNNIKVNESNYFKFGIRDHNSKHDIIYKYLWGNKKERINYKNQIKKIFKKCHIEVLLGEYDYCHIWGCTRNPYLNNALWNIYVIPKFCSYLTDKEYGGEIGSIIRKKIKNKIKEECKSEIIKYNQFMYNRFNSTTKYYRYIINKEYENDVKNINMKYIYNQLILINISDNNLENDYVLIFSKSETSNSVKCIFDDKNIDFKKLYGINI